MQLTALIARNRDNQRDANSVYSTNAKKNKMTQSYEKYHEQYFLQMNDPTREAFESAAKAYATWYRRFLPANKSIKILDVGCGMGHFLYFLEKEGYTNYWGIDLSPSQVRFVGKNVTKRVTLADAFDYLRTNDAFDVIAANDILEHISKDATQRFLTLLHDALKANGLLFIKTPNMSNPFGLKSRYQDFTHQVGFTEDSLKLVLRVSGFRELQITGTSYAVQSRRSWIAKLGEWITHKILEQMFKAQGYTHPNILEPNLIAICVKGEGSTA